VLQSHFAMTEIDRIVRLLEKTFEQQPWYGDSIMEILSHVDSESATTKHGDAHTIIELVLHMASWRQFVIQRLIGDAEFEITDERNFPVPTTLEKAIEQLTQSQQTLVEVTKQFPAERLTELVPSKILNYTYYTLLHGIIQHDIYHLGQIALLEKINCS
jgi:uncharacterized damage-inducible protein DinB